MRADLYTVKTAKSWNHTIECSTVVRLKMYSPGANLPDYLTNVFRVTRREGYGVTLGVDCASETHITLHD